jgi:hypothetical protein
MARRLVAVMAAAAGASAFAPAALPFTGMARVSAVKVLARLLARFHTLFSVL